MVHLDEGKERELEKKVHEGVKVAAALGLDRKTFPGRIRLLDCNLNFKQSVFMITE